MEPKEGYITDIEYVHGIYRELAPSALNMVLLVQSLEPVALENGFTYLDLGCGQGESTSLFAACHPQGDFHGVDFNPSHIAGARALAAESRLANVSFWEASFADLERLALPDFDFVVMHGIYSWVGEENRRELLKFLRDKLKPGGVVFLSYNCLPGWSQHAPLRQLLSLYAETLTGPLERRVEEAVAFVRTLRLAGASVFAGNPATGEFFDYVCTLPRNYLAHEFFNREWTLFYHSEVVRELAACELAFAGSAVLAENQDLLRFNQAQMQVLDAVAPRVMRETLKDYLLSPLMRRDVFVRGGATMAPGRQMEHFAAQRLALVVPLEKLERKAQFPIGEVLLEPALYDPILAAFAAGALSLRELMQIPAVAALGTARVTETLMVLLSAQYLMPAVEPTPAALAAVKRLNARLLERRMDHPGPQPIGSPLLQSAIKVEWLDRLMIHCELDGTADPLWCVWEKMQAQGQKLTRDGRPLTSQADNMAELVLAMKAFRENKLPLLRQLGIV